MKRQNRSKKNRVRWPPFLAPIVEFIAERAVPIVTVLIFLAVLALAVNAFLYRSDYFRVRTVEVKDAIAAGDYRAGISGELLKAYKGKNIFSVEIKRAALILEASYADAKRVSVTRVLPDKLLVRLNFRRPVAVLKNAREYPVDEDGVILSNVDGRKLSGLPVITGVGHFASRQIAAAISVLKAVRESKLLTKYGIVSLDARDIKELSFYFASGLEVKIGCENLQPRIRLLENTLRDPRLMADRIRYIDVRFENAVIGPKE